MDTFNPLENMNDLNKSEFEDELIERFFDHKSYYLQGFMSHLRNNETTFENPLDMVAVGLLVDEIINAPNKTEKLRQLERFDRFNFYRQQLSEGIKYLESSKLSTQQMMDIVGSLGKSFAETLGTLVAHQDSRKYLLKMVGLDEELKKSASGPQNVTAETPALKEKPISNKKSSALEDPWDLFKRDVNKKIKTIQELIGKLEKNPNSWEIFKLIKNGYKDLRDWSMIQGDQGIEAISHKILLLFEAVYVRAPEKRNLINPILKEAVGIIQTINNTGPGSENLDIVRVMAHQIDIQRNAFPEQVSVQREEEFPSFPDEKNDEKTLVVSPVEDQPEVKVEPFEHENDLEKKAAPAEENQTEELFIEQNLLPELQENFVETLQQDEEKEEIQQDDFLDSFDREFSEYLNEFNAHRQEQNEESVSEPDPVRENSAEEENAGDLQPFDSIRDSEMLSELVTENADRLDEMEFPELEEVEDTSLEYSQKDNEESKDITLPGEDDQELMDIISDIHLEQDGMENNNFDSEFAEIEQKTENENAGESGRVNQNYSSGYQTPKTGSGADFVEEADMYFSFAKKALQNLMKNSSDRQALEDMELACYSLKTIGDKLGYQEIGKMMGFAENFIQKRISGKNGLKTDQINTLFSIVDELEKAGSEQSYTSPDRKQWFSNQELTLKNWISPPSNPVKKNVQPSFQNREKKSSFKQTQAEDPLDFLLFDDTSKYFKQLLKE